MNCTDSVRKLSFCKYFRLFVLYFYSVSNFRASIQPPHFPRGFLRAGQSPPCVGEHSLGYMPNGPTIDNRQSIADGWSEVQLVHGKLGPGRHGGARVAPRGRVFFFSRSFRSLSWVLVSQAFWRKTSEKEGTILLGCHPFWALPSVLLADCLPPS